MKQENIRKTIEGMGNIIGRMLDQKQSGQNII